tara:strand:+ start:83 stop:2119 length:2037 start_codon:yes stop_codon:yes gene_type:complete
MAFIAKKLISASGVQEETDDDFNLVTGLYHFDGSNGAQNKTFLDSSSNGFTVTRAGSSTQGTFSPFSADEGKWSVEFPGGGTSDVSRIALGSTNEYVFGTGDFTIEAWVFPRSYLTLPNANFILDFRNSNAGYNINVVMYLAYNASTSSYNLYGWTGNAASGITLNAWNHVAIVRESGSEKGFVNGVQKYSASETSNHQYSGSGVNIGNRYASTWGPFDGFISNVRIVKGTAVYTGNFTPSTSPLTNVTNTVNLGLRLNRFADSVSSVVPYLNTTSGPIKIQPFSPFAPSAAYDPAVNGGAFYGDGSGDYASIAASSDFDVLSNGTFTIDFWFYRINALGTYADYVGIFNGVSAGVLIYQNGSTFDVYINGSTIFNVTHPNLHEWIHVALTRDGTTLRLFLNGVASGTSTASLGTSNYPLNIAGDSTGRAGVQGYVSDVRVVKGTAVYTSAFTPPTAPSTAITNTEALLSFTNAAMFDQSGTTNAITRANTQLDTSVKKFGTASAEFDGTSDNLHLVNVVPIGTSPFTIEFFFRSNTTSLDTYYRRMYKMATVTSQNNAWCEICINSSSGSYGSGNNIFMYTPGNTIIGTATPFDNNWHHFALTRDTSNNLKMFVDGTQDGSTVTGFTNDLTQTEHLVGANDTTGNGDFLGYIDELRLTMKARYTSNFTAPTKEFANR